MKKRVSDQFWFPWWPDKWIFGSIRIECTLEERAIWVDLLSLASKDNGYIRANEEMSYPVDQLAGMLRIPEETLSKAIDKFISLKDKHGKGKLTRTKEGTLYVTKWEKYQFSESYHRVKKHREKEGDNPVSNDDSLQCNKEELPYNNIINKNTLNNNIINKSKIEFDFDERKFTNITIEDKSGWKDAYPACDIEHELKGMREWLLANPSKRKSNYRKFITNWLSRQQDKGGTKLNYEDQRKKKLDDWVKKPVKD